MVLFVAFSAVAGDATFVADTAPLTSDRVGFVGTSRGASIAELCCSTSTCFEMVRKLMNATHKTKVKSVIRNS